MELPKLAAKGKATGGEGFLRAFRDIGRSDDRQEDYQVKELDSLYEAASYSHLNEEEIQAYESEMSTEEDYKEWHEYEVERARKEAVQEAARKMLAEGISTDIVLRCTGLSKEEILS